MVFRLFRKPFLCAEILVQAHLFVFRFRSEGAFEMARRVIQEGRVQDSEVLVVFVSEEYLLVDVLEAHLVRGQVNDSYVVEEFVIVIDVGRLEDE